MDKHEKSLSSGQRLILAALAAVIVLLAVLIFIMVRNAPGRQEKTAAETTQTAAADAADAGQPEQTETAEAGTVSDGETAKLPDGVVLQCGSRQLDSLTFNYYYWDTYFGVLGSYGSSITDYFDPTLPLSEQIYDESTGQTWQELFESLAVSSAMQVLAFVQIAEHENFAMPQEYADNLTDLIEQYRTSALEQGYASLDAYLQATYGDEADEAGFLAYQTDYQLATAYTDTLYDTPVFTDEEVSDYFDEHAEEYESLGVSKDDTPMVDLRHIMITPDDSTDDAAWQVAEDEARALYESWQQNPTEEFFAQLAEENSDDTASVGNGGDWTELYNGGLYQRVYNGSMDEAFGAWLFDEARAAGDVTLIKTDDAWHLLYFVGREDMPFWRYTAEMDLRYETYQTASDALLADYSCTYDGDNLVLHTPEGLYEED